MKLVTHCVTLLHIVTHGKVTARTEMASKQVAMAGRRRGSAAHRAWTRYAPKVLGVFLFSCTIVKMLNSTILKKIEGVVKQIVDATI